MLRLTTHIYIRSNEFIVIWSSKLAVYCTIWLDTSSVILEYRVIYLVKGTFER